MGTWAPSSALKYSPMKALVLFLKGGGLCLCVSTLIVYLNIECVCLLWAGGPPHHGGAGASGAAEEGEAAGPFVVVLCGRSAASLPPPGSLGGQEGCTGAEGTLWSLLSYFNREWCC